MTISGADLVLNDTHVLIKLNGSGEARRRQHYDERGLRPLFAKREGCWYLPFWLLLELFEQAGPVQLFATHVLQLPSEGGELDRFFWVYHCVGCRQLVIAELTQPKFHIFAAKTGVSPWWDQTPVVPEQRYFLVCPNRLCGTVNYLPLELPQSSHEGTSSSVPAPEPPASVPDSPRPRRRPRASRPAVPPANPRQTARRRRSRRTEPVEA